MDTVLNYGMSHLDWISLLEPNQMVAYFLSLFSILVFNLELSASYEATSNGVVTKKIVKKNRIPNWLIKIGFIWVMFIFSYQLWYSTAIIIGIIAFIMLNINRLQPLLKLLQPVITEAEKRK
jgi:hypothetical protein